MAPSNTDSSAAVADSMIESPTPVTSTALSSADEPSVQASGPAVPAEVLWEHRRRPYLRWGYRG